MATEWAVESERVHGWELALWQALSWRSGSQWEEVRGLPLMQESAWEWGRMAVMKWAQVLV